ncbi:unnamed protein product [Meganyctiphanes norvegica]|uniref:C2H2-type domain-containing protein n=1 Tax=Meganyctiphanes norvegica TaxID=48144 RepID=A0AAV2QXA2_MEGNR
MKFYPVPADSPDGVSAWVHEDLLEPRYGSHQADSAKTTSVMDPLDSFLPEMPNNDHLPTPSGNFAELKPLEPLDYLTASPDTSASSRLDSSTSSHSPGSQYKGAITNSNTFLGYTGLSEVSTTTNISPTIKQEQPQQTTFSSLQSSDSITQEIDDIASLIGSAIADNVHTSISSIMLPETLEPINVPEFQDIEAFFESMSGGTHVKVEPQSDPLINSTMSPTGLSPTSITQQLQQSSNNDHSEYPHTTSTTPMLQQLLAAGAVTNNNYLHGLVTESSYRKSENFSPILQARLTQGLKDVGSGLLKPDPMFSTSQYSYRDLNTLDTYTVTTTDDFLISKFDPRSYLDKSMLSPDSNDRFCLDSFGSKNKNRNRKNHGGMAKLPIATEGTKDKPIHRCTVCNRGFLNKSNIKVHLRTHTGEKPFKCETCGKAFRQKAHLLKHYQIHKRVTRD